MEVSIIIILSLAIIYVIVDIIRESQQKKWFKRGYMECAYKHDKKIDDEPYDDSDAEEIFEKLYGFKYY